MPSVPAMLISRIEARKLRRLVAAVGAGILLGGLTLAGVTRRCDPAHAIQKRPALRTPPRNTVAVEKPADAAHVTFAADVAPIVAEHCQACHRPGQVAPFSLMTYDEMKRWAGPIREAVENGRMPPWHADPRIGTFQNDRHLSARQRGVLLAWLAEKMPLGDPQQLPPPRSFSHDWSIGAPDAVLTMAEPYKVVAEGVLAYQRFRVPSGFTEDRWIAAAEARPGNRAVVHHICVFVADDRPKADRMADELREIVCYAPGDLPSVFPPGTAKLVPAGATLVIEVHYTPNGRIQHDQSSVALVFAKAPVARRAFTKGISQKHLEIPPGVSDYEVASSFTFPKDARLLSLSPHMHLRGRDFLYTATYPDGRTEPLLRIPAYDFAWQGVYRLTEPKPMPRGTRIDCVAHFDNSSANPANPDPTATVRWGDQTYDEMMIGFIDFDELLSSTPSPLSPFAGHAPRTARLER